MNLSSCKREAIKAASDTPDAYTQIWTRFTIGWEELHRGRINEARDSARELMQFGRLVGELTFDGTRLGIVDLYSAGVGFLRRGARVQ